MQTLASAMKPVRRDERAYQSIAGTFVQRADATMRGCEELLIPPPGLEPGSLGGEPSILTSKTVAENNQQKQFSANMSLNGPRGELVSMDSLRRSSVKKVERYREDSVAALPQ